MNINRELIEKIIDGRKVKNDPVLNFAVRNKASPLKFWFDFVPFERKYFNRIYENKYNIDGVKLQFKTVTLVINGRHRPN